MIKRICIFGASIAFGSGDYEFGGWQNHLKVWFGKRGKYQHVFNLAVSGRTSFDIITRFKNELTFRNSSDPENNIMALVSISVNDTRFTIGEKGQKKFEVTLTQFKQNLEKIKKLADKYADELVILEITKVVDNKTSFWEGSVYSWQNQIIKKYNKILQNFCKENNIFFCPMYDVLEEEDLPDGLHPNPHGHQKMFERIRDFLVEKGVV